MNGLIQNKLIADWVEIFDRDTLPGSASDLDKFTPKTERVRYLFHDAPLSPDARLMAVVRSRPIERFIAAAAWWPEGNVGKFQLACQPMVARATVAGLLIESLETCAR